MRSVIFECVMPEPGEYDIQVGREINLASNRHSVDWRRLIDAEGSRVYFHFGFDLHVMSYLPQDLAQYTGSYIFITPPSNPSRCRNDRMSLFPIKKQLFYIKYNSVQDLIIEPVAINDVDLFEKNIGTMNPTHLGKIRLNSEQINTIITSNGGHTQSGSLQTLAEPYLDGGRVLSDQELDALRDVIFLDHVLTDDMTKDEKESLLLFMNKAFHQGGLMFLVATAVVEFLGEKQLFFRAQEDMTRDIVITTRARGFTIKETCSIAELWQNVGQDVRLVANSVDGLPPLRAESLIDVDFSQPVPNKAIFEALLNQNMITLEDIGWPRITIINSKLVCTELNAILSSTQSVEPEPGPEISYNWMLKVLGNPWVNRVGVLIVLAGLALLALSLGFLTGQHAYAGIAMVMSIFLKVSPVTLSVIGASVGLVGTGIATSSYVAQSLLDERTSFFKQNTDTDSRKLPQTDIGNRPLC